LADAGNGDKDEQSFADNEAIMQTRRFSKRVHNEKIKNALKAITPEMKKRQLPFKVRASIQKTILQLPLLPITAIGSYPQTQDVRDMRAKFKQGEMTETIYEKFLQEKIIDVMKWGSFPQTGALHL